MISHRAARCCCACACTGAVLQVQRGPPIKAKLRGKFLSTFRSAISGTDFCTCSCKRYLIGMWWAMAVVSNHSPNMCQGVRKGLEHSQNQCGFFTSCTAPPDLGGLFAASMKQATEAARAVPYAVSSGNFRCRRSNLTSSVTYVAACPARHQIAQRRFVSLVVQSLA
jgi:hypothetical protein